MKKPLIALILVAVGLAGFIKFDVVPDSVETVLGGGNLPDRCEVFDQVSSRSSKDTVKASGGHVYSVTVSSTATLGRFFQLHDQATNPTTVSTPEFSIPLSSTTASATPTLLTWEPKVPMKFDNGIAFTISNAFATFSTQSDQAYRNSYFVSICWY